MHIYIYMYIYIYIYIILNIYVECYVLLEAVTRPQQLVLFDFCIPNYSLLAMASLIKRLPKLNGFVKY